MDERYRQTLENTVRTEPDVVIRAVVRFTEVPDDLEERLASHGVGLRHVFHLISAAAVEARPAGLLGLLDEPWVVDLEEDREVGAGR